MDGEYPPKICVFSEFRGKKSKRELNSENVGELDRMVINTCDCSINCYESPRFPGKKTGYLRQLYVIQDPAVEYNGKYDDWMNDDPNETSYEMPEEEDNRY